MDVLPDRAADTVAAWLRQHPTIQVISRDRGATYARGAREGAPKAQQVADRFHLLENWHDHTTALIGPWESPPPDTEPITECPETSAMETVGGPEDIWTTPRRVPLRYHASRPGGKPSIGSGIKGCLSPPSPSRCIVVRSHVI